MEASKFYFILKPLYKGRPSKCINMYFNVETKCWATVCFVLEWIRIAQDKVMYRELVYTVMKAYTWASEKVFRE
jgi:hypothetical protein